MICLWSPVPVTIDGESDESSCDSLELNFDKRRGFFVCHGGCAKQ